MLNQIRLYEEALKDLEKATNLCPTNPDVKKLINKINDDMMISNHIHCKSNNSTMRSKDLITLNSSYHSSTLNSSKTGANGSIKSHKKILAQSQSNLIESHPL